MTYAHSLTHSLEYTLLFLCMSNKATHKKSSKFNSYKTKTEFAGTVKCVCLHKIMMYLWFLSYFSRSLSRSAILVFRLIYIAIHLFHVRMFRVFGVVVAQTIVFKLQVFCLQFVNALLRFTVLNGRNKIDFFNNKKIVKMMYTKSNVCACAFCAPL